MIHDTKPNKVRTVLIIVATMVGAFKILDWMTP